MNSNLIDPKHFLHSLTQGIPLSPLPPPIKSLDPTLPHAPPRHPTLSQSDKTLALINSLRYFPKEFHAELAPEFLSELETYGHIYMYRFRPNHYEMKAYPIENYPAKNLQISAIQMMIMNNLDKEVAQFPHELITYGGNGSVFSNWAQFHLTMKYLSEMTIEQTLIMNSGHPQGLYPSHSMAPRVVISNGNMIPNYSSREHYELHYALGNTIYGEMTAGSYCYIGSQGIVHGTTITLYNMVRKYMKKEVLKGVVFVTSGLGGMSGAQPKAGDICGCITVIAEVNERALDKRVKQGWLKEKCVTLEETIKKIKEARVTQEKTSIGYLGNIVDLWEKLAEEKECLVELGSDQTSLHDPFGGGYYPAGLTYEESNELMRKNHVLFKEKVQESLRRQVVAINKMSKKGMIFWDYGNSFLLESSRANADIWLTPEKKSFKYLSYFEAVMDDLFALGFGPFRWICTTGLEADLLQTDKIAEEVITSLLKECPKELERPYLDNLQWIKNAHENKLVIGCQARILYADADARILIGLGFNNAIANGIIKGPVILSRDHHDVSGTDSPFRETSNIKDGSKFTADMAVQNVIGDAMRGATWVALHNGGGVGWGEVVNGGFGLVVDGSEEAEKKLRMMLFWDVNNGIGRRAWSGSANAEFNIKRQMEKCAELKVTVPVHADEELIKKIVGGI